MAALQLKTSEGRVIEFEADRQATVGDTRTALIRNEGYSEHVRIMYAGKILHDDANVLVYPRGSLVVVGHPKPAASRQQRHPRHPRGDHEEGRGGGGRGGGRENGRQESRGDEGRGGEGQDGPDAQRGRPAEAAESGPASPARPGHSQSPARDLTQPMTVHVLVPASGTTLSLQLLPTSTLAELLELARARAPELAAAKLVFKGRLLDDPLLELRQLGVQDGMTLHAAVGALADPNSILLLQVTESVDKVRAALPTAEGQERKGLHEQLMRQLFQLDDLVDVGDDLRARRKALVHDIQVLQDEINKS